MPTLDCGIAALREWRRGDEHDLVAVANNPNVSRYLRDRFPCPYSPDDAAAWIALNEAADVTTHFAIVLEDRVIGGAGFQLFEAERRVVAEIGYWLGEPLWGRGIATAACRTLTKYVFDRHEIRRIEAPVFTPNVASLRVLEKCGYEREGVMRNAAIKQGKILDAYLYSKLKS
jgi:ribosomal-protein-alanine N-acetyltransferase